MEGMRRRNPLRPVRDFNCRTGFLILKMLYLKSRVLRRLVAHMLCATASHKNLARVAL